MSRLISHPAFVNNHDIIYGCTFYASYSLKNIFVSIKTQPIVIIYVSNIIIKFG